MQSVAVQGLLCPRAPAERLCCCVLLISIGTYVRGVHALLLNSKKHVEQLDDVVADMTGSTYEVRKEAETIILRAWHSCAAIYVPFAP